MQIESAISSRAPAKPPSLVDETIDQAPVGILSSVARWVRQNFNYPPLLLLFTTGVFLRVILMATYFPAVMLSFDSARYARIDSMPMFGDFWMPAGYPMLLGLLHAISHQLWLPSPCNTSWDSVWGFSCLRPPGNSESTGRCHVCQQRYPFFQAITSISNTR